MHAQFHSTEVITSVEHPKWKTKVVCLHVERVNSGPQQELFLLFRSGREGVRERGGGRERESERGGGRKRERKRGRERGGGEIAAGSVHFFLSYSSAGVPEPPAPPTPISIHPLPPPSTHTHRPAPPRHTHTATDPPFHTHTAPPPTHTDTPPPTPPCTHTLPPPPPHTHTATDPPLHTHTAPPPPHTHTHTATDPPFPHTHCSGRCMQCFILYALLVLRRRHSSDSCGRNGGGEAEWKLPELFNGQTSAVIDWCVDRVVCNWPTTNRCIIIHGVRNNVCNGQTTNRCVITGGVCCQCEEDDGRWVRGEATLVLSKEVTPTWAHSELLRSYDTADFWCTASVTKQPS